MLWGTRNTVPLAIFYTKGITKKSPPLSDQNQSAPPSSRRRGILPALLRRGWGGVHYKRLNAVEPLPRPRAPLHLRMERGWGEGVNLK